MDAGEQFLGAQRPQTKQKIAKLRAASPKELHIISDFDRTLTPKFLNDGKKMASSYALLRQTDLFKTDFGKRAQERFDRYYPLEMDPAIPIEEKRVFMNEWWTLAWDDKLESGLNKQAVDQLSKVEYLQLREDADKLILLTTKHHIPLLIFSAGIGNLIEAILAKHNLVKPNVHVVANFLHFNDQGEPISYTKPLIHSFNKSEIALKNTPHFDQIKKRRNVILLGDSLGDHHMADGIEHNVVLKIGLLNEHVEELKEEYLKRYDLLLVNDAPLTPVVKLIESFLETVK